MKKIAEFINKAELFTAAFCFAGTTFLIFIAAVARTLNHPINWSIDISLFLFSWCTFLSADVALHYDKLVSVDLLVSKFPERYKKALSISIFLTILVFLGLLAAYGSKLAYTSRSRAFQGIPKFSYTWITLSLPVGALLMIRTTIQKIKALIKGSSF
ncbi:hypothetical protein ES707_12679 [subsurface metagenome]